MTTDQSTTIVELEERIRDGDTTITAQDLAEAQSRERFASLQAEAESRAQEHARAAEHDAAVQRVTADYERLQGADAKAARAAYAKAVSALDALRSAASDLGIQVREVRSRAAALGILDGRFQDLYRVMGYSPDHYVEMAIKESSEPLAYPHALHTDAQVAEAQERQQAKAEAEAARQARARENVDVVVDRGVDLYSRIEL